MSSNASSYQQKFQKIVGQTSFGMLPNDEQVFFREKAAAFRFTFQELRQVSEMSLDRLRWKERPLSADWPESQVAGDYRAEKKRALSILKEKQQALRTRGAKGQG
jgi:hypothetical protein